MTPVAAVGRGRVRAFRIVAGIFGALTVLSNMLFTFPVLTNESDRVHSFHELGAFAPFTLFVGLALIVLAIHPDDVVALRVAWAATIGVAIGSFIGQDFVSGTYYIAPIVLIVLTILAPTRGELVRLGSPNIAMVCLAILAAVPAIVYAWDNGRIMLQGDPMHDPTGHWAFHHWSGIAGAALAMVLAGVVVAFRREGDRLWVWVVGLSAMVFGSVGVIFADDVRYPSSIGVLWGTLTIFIGVVYIAVGELTTPKEPLR